MMVEASEILDFFAEIFASLDANPREMKIQLSFEMDASTDAKLDLVRGEPVFIVGEDIARARFRKRWLAEHPVPLTLRAGLKMKFYPTTGNRVKVRI